MSRKEQLKKEIERLTIEKEKKEKKLKQQVNLLKKQQARLKEQIRKERTHNLIRIGGVVYSVLEREYQEGDVQRLMNFLQNQKEIFSSAMTEHIEAAYDETEEHN